MKKIFDDASFFFFFLSCAQIYKRGDATGKSAARGRTTTTGEKREDNADDDVFVFFVFVAVHVSVHVVVVAFFDEIWSVVVETSYFGSRKEWSDSKRAHQRFFFFFFE